MRHCPTGLRAIAHYIEIGRAAIEVEFGCDFRSKTAARPIRELEPACLRRGAWQLQHVVLFRGTTFSFR